MLAADAEADLSDRNYERSGLRGPASTSPNPRVLSLETVAMSSAELMDSMPQDVEDGIDEDPATYSIGEALDHIGFGWFQVVMLFYCGCAWAADAMEMMLLSFLGPAVRCEWGISPSQESLITSIVFCGTMAGAYSWGVLGDARGRRVGFFGTAMFTFFFGVLSAGAPNYLCLVVLRGLMGVGLGGAPVSFALFLELVPSSARGILMVALQSFWTVGSMIEAGLAWALLSDWGWRWLVVVSSVPLLLLMLLYPFLPESPFWLLATGQTARAQELLGWIARLNGRSLPKGRLQHSKAAAAEKVQDELKPGLEAEESGAPAKGGGSRAWGPVAELATAMRPLLTGRLRRTTLLLMLIWFVNALCYYGLVLLTTTLHAQQSGASACSASGQLRLASTDLRDIFIAATAELPGLLAAAVVMDALGRKLPLAVSQIVIGVCTGALMLTWRGQTALLFTSRALSMGSYAILYVYTPEVFPTRLRTFGLGVNNAMSRIGALLSPFLAVDLVERGHPGAAEACIAVFCVAAAIATAALPVETSGKALMVDAGEDEEPVLADNNDTASLLSGPDSRATAHRNGVL